MKSIYKYLTPNWLMKVDLYLLRSHPVLWRTNFHFIIFYAFISALVLFLIGFLSLVSLNDDKSEINTISPVDCIDMNNDIFYITPMALILGALVFSWPRKQNEIGYELYRAKDTLITLCMYFLVLWFALGFTASAYKLGLMTKTAWFWIDEKDLLFLENSNICRKGFILMEKDSVFKISGDTISFFKKRERSFTKILQEEQTILNNRYEKDIRFWRNFSKNSYWYKSDGSDLKNQLKEYYRDYLFLMNFSKHRYYLNYPYYLSTRIERPILEYYYPMEDETFLSILVSPLKFKRNKLVVMKTEYENLKQYESIYIKCIDSLGSKYSLDIASKYNLIDYKYFGDGGKLLLRHNIRVELEKAIRCVHNTRAYFSKGIFWVFFFKLPNYLLIISSLIFLTHCKSNQYNSLNLIYLYLMSIIYIVTFTSARQEHVWYQLSIVNNIFYLFLPLTGIVFLFFSFLSRDPNLFLILGRFALISGLFLLLISSYLGNFLVNFSLSVFQISSPLNFSFYTAQMVGLVGAVFTPYVQALPRKQ